MYTSATTATDELFVFGTFDETPAKPAIGGTPSDFSVTHPLPHFHKPELVIATDIALPVPVGITVPVTTAKDTTPVRLNLELPEGVEIVGGGFGGQNIRREDAIELPQGGGTRHALSGQLGKGGKSEKDFGRLYFSGPRLERWPARNAPLHGRAWRLEECGDRSAAGRGGRSSGPSVEADHGRARLVHCGDHRRMARRL